MLVIVIDDARALVAPAEHWMSPLFQTVALYRPVIYKKELVCASHNADIDVGYVAKPMNFWKFSKAAK